MHKSGSGFLQSSHSGYGMNHKNWVGCGSLSTYNPQLRPVSAGMGRPNLPNVSQPSNPCEDFPQTACLPSTDLLGNPVIFQQVEMDSNQSWMPIGPSLNNLKNIVALPTTISVGTPDQKQIPNSLHRPVASSQDGSGCSRSSRTFGSALQTEEPNISHQVTSLGSCDMVKQSQKTMTLEVCVGRDTSVDYLDEDILPQSTCDDNGKFNLSKAGEIDEGPIIHLSVPGIDHAYIPARGRWRDISDTKCCLDSTDAEDFKLPFDVTKFTSQLTASCHLAIQSIDPDTEPERGFVAETANNWSPTKPSVQLSVTEADRDINKMFQIEDDKSFECYVDDWLDSLRNLPFDNVSDEYMDQTTNVRISKKDFVNTSGDTVNSELPFDIRQFICEITPSNDVITPSIYPDIEHEKGFEEQTISETVSNNFSTIYDRRFSINIPGLETGTEMLKPYQTFESYSDEVFNEFRRTSSENTSEDCQMILDGIKKLRNCKIDEFIAAETKTSNQNKQDISDITIAYMVDSLIQTDRYSLVQIRETTVPLEEPVGKLSDSTLISIDVASANTVPDNQATVLEITTFTSEPDDACPTERHSVPSEIVLDLDESVTTYETDGNSLPTNVDMATAELQLPTYQINGNVFGDLNALLGGFLRGTSISTSTANMVFKQIIQLIPSLAHDTSDATGVKTKSPELSKTGVLHEAPIAQGVRPHTAQSAKNDMQDRCVIDCLLEEISKPLKPLVIHLKNDWNMAADVSKD